MFNRKEFEFSAEAQVHTLSRGIVRVYWITGWQNVSEFSGQHKTH